MEFLPRWATAYVLQMGGLCLVNSTYRHDCRQLSASGCKLYDIRVGGLSEGLCSPVLYQTIPPVLRHHTVSSVTGRASSL